ncbi:alpha-glucuronidase [Lapidilactobacillus bayanensis]|uniref:alpha-glucuronidase n=1 Tax=Lapidilactobacillus bayanensis TaxID=2485998 RepID=UPI000F778837|nr:alpha-glucuronidase [Lapidilactobacillus bayanensis]
MTDNCWLNNNVVNSVSQLQFYIKNITKEDRVSINIRSEIVTYFKANLTEDETHTDVILGIDAASQDGFEILNNSGQYIITAANNQNLLYGLYYFCLHYHLGDLQNHELKQPDQAIRMIDQWDNFDGSIERGYAGESIFYDHNEFLGNYERIEQYARLLASVGINYIAINNVNVHKRETFFISDEFLPKIKQIVDVFAKFGIKVLLSINFASPIRLGNLKTADPLDTEVKQWWIDRAKTIYRVIPDFGGFLVKADSEGEPGPFAYGRNHAEGANMLAAALKPFNGLVIWRAFVYNSQQDWRDKSVDRARAAFDNFIGLDGQFMDNVVLQIKFGPIDFQTREPVQPLFGALKHTNQIIEFQITQEYTGHQIDLNYLLPQWHRVLHFDTFEDNKSALLKDIPSRNSIISANSGFAAVSNIGRDENWTGNQLAQSNLYGFGRIAWNNDLTPDQILAEWTQLTFSDSEVCGKVSQILATSNETYENYTAPLGVGFMVTPHYHYGPSINGYEYDRWGTYHYADRNGLGVDRTLATGTGYTRQYSNHNFELYENLATCPDELLLFFHHVSYSHVLHNGETVIQHIYNTHFQGYEAVVQYLNMWVTLQGKVPESVYQNVLLRLQKQVDNAKEWCDQVNTFFYRMSGVDDVQQRKIYR